MDVLSIIGVIAAFGLILFGMLSGSGENLAQLLNFFDAYSIAIVAGGTFAALMIMFPLKVFAELPKLLAKIFVPQKYNPKNYIEGIVEIAFDARENGILSLEEKIPDYTDGFVRRSIQLAVDATSPADLRDIMESELEFVTKRQKNGVMFFEKGAVLAPGFGMAGTLVGLINMFASHNAPESLMPGMTAALITTLYGIILANVIFLPMGNKLQKRNDEEALCKQIIIEGVVAITNGENPKQIQDKLISYVNQI